MKISDYQIHYALGSAHHDQPFYLIEIDGKKHSLFELIYLDRDLVGWNMDLDLELSEENIHILDEADEQSLFMALSRPGITQEEAIGILDDMYMDFLQRQGEPLKWIQRTYSIFEQWERSFPGQIRNPVRSYLKQLMEEVSRIQHPRQEKRLPSLDEMIDKKDLARLVDILLREDAAHETESGYQWTGIKTKRMPGKKLQLVALSYAACVLCKKHQYEQQELHHAWTRYFNVDTSVNMWSDTKRPAEDSEYSKYFNKLIYSISR